jgi:hypothetical protein
MAISYKELKPLLKKKAKNGKITCAQALAIAEETGVPPSKVGAALDELDIRITDCKLGCFE